MIFYLAVGTDNMTKILGTQADAAKVNKDFVQIDIPTDKAGLMAWIQQMLDETLNAIEPEVSGSTEAVVTIHRCSECNEPQFQTPSGLTCENGHGGADSVDEPVTPPKPVVHHNPQVAEILTALEVGEFIETVGEKRLQEIELCIAVRRDKLNRTAAKEADVEAD